MSDNNSDSGNSAQTSRKVKLCHRLQTESSFQALRYAFNFIAWILELLLLNNIAQQLSDESISVASELYDINWIDCSVSMQKCIRFMLQRSQKPLTLSTGPIGILNLATFLSIMRSAYSFFALFQKFKK